MFILYSNAGQPTRLLRLLVLTANGHLRFGPMWIVALALAKAMPIET